MLRYTIQRTLLMVPTLIGITLIAFFVMLLAPGDPVDLFLGGAAGSEGISTDRQPDVAKIREELRRQLGLDRPVYVQYFSWLSKLVLHLEPLTGYERAAREVDRFLAGLRPEDRRRLARVEDGERKALLLRFMEERDAELGRSTALSPFWQGRSVQLEDNYAYEGAGIVLLTAFDTRFVTLNFGRSFKDQRPVILRIGERLPITMEISIVSLVIAYLIGIPLGVVMAVKQNTATDRALTTASFVLWSMPTFWVGMLLITFFCNREFFYWFPASGIQSLELTPQWGIFQVLSLFWEGEFQTSWRLLTDHLHHLAMPVLASTYSGYAGISRYMRTSMLENTRLDYVRTARAKGLDEQTVVMKHILRNSLIPIVTIMAYFLPSLIAGSVFIETIFTVPGIGYLGYQSVLVRDYPVAMGILTIASALSLLGILIADLLLKVVDPRISFSRVEGG